MARSYMFKALFCFVATPIRARDVYPLIVPKPPPQAKATSVLAVVDNKGIVSRKSVQGAYNKELFLEFLQSLQLPLDTVILLDNVRFHHSNVIKEFVQTKQWTLLYVPNYGTTITLDIF